VAVDFWYEPSPTAMVAFNAGISTIATHHSACVDCSGRVLDAQFFLDPNSPALAPKGVGMRVSAEA